MTQPFSEPYVAPARDHRSTLRIALAFGLVCVIYVGVSLSLRPDAFFVCDMGVKYVQVESFLRNGFRGMALEYPGEWFDPNAEFYPNRWPSTYTENGRVYSTFPPAFCALSAIPYRLLGMRGLYVIPLACGLGTVLLIPFIARYLRIRHRVWAMLLVGLGTPLCFYSVLFWEHAVAAFLLALSLFFVVRAFRTHSARDVAWSGVVAGAGPLFRTEMFFALLVMAFAFVIMASRWRVRFATLLLFSLGAAVCVWPLIVFNLSAYGTLFGSHVLQNVQLDSVVPLEITWLGALARKLRVLSIHLLFGRDFFNVRWADLLLFSPFALAVAAWCVPKFRWKKQARIALFAGAAVVAVWIAVTCQTVAGFFAASPAMLLAFAGESPLRRRGKGPRFRVGPVAFLYIVGLLFCVLVFLTVPVLGDPQFGPRFLLPLYVPAGLLAVRFLETTEVRWGPRGVGLAVAAVLIACSLVMGARGMMFAHRQKAIAGGVKDAISEADARIVVSDTEVLAVTGPLYFERLMFWVPDDPGMQRLEAVLSRAGVQEVLIVTRDTRPAGPMGIAVAAPDSPEVPVMRAGDIRYLLGRLQPPPARNP